MQGEGRETCFVVLYSVVHRFSDILYQRGIEGNSDYSYDCKGMHGKQKALFFTSSLEEKKLKLLQLVLGTTMSRELQTHWMGFLLIEESINRL